MPDGKKTTTLMPLRCSERVIIHYNNYKSQILILLFLYPDANLLPSGDKHIVQTLLEFSSKLKSLKFYSY